MVSKEVKRQINRKRRLAEEEHYSYKINTLLMKSNGNVLTYPLPHPLWINTPPRPFLQEKPPLKHKHL